MKRLVLNFLVFNLVTLSVFADDCLTYKTNTDVSLVIPEWKKEVVQPLKPMDLFHGNVVATLVEDYEIIADTTPIEDGFCVSLKYINATIGYSDFLVKIDSRHIYDSCSYNAVLAHEDEHIRTYLSVIEDYKNDIKNSVQNASNSITPVFVKSSDEIDMAVDTLNKNLQSHPDVILIKQKISAEEELRNKRIDQNSNNDLLKKCI